MAITNFIPTIWAGALLSSLKNALVYGQAQVANRNYQGEISGRGDTVKITALSAISVRDYTDHTDATRDALTDTTQSLVIDQQKYFNFEVGDIEQAQSQNAGGLMTEAMTEAGYALAGVADSFIAGLYTGAAAGNQLDAGVARAITSPALAFQGVVDLRQVLNESNVPIQGRYVVVPPWYESLLIADDRFLRVDASGSDGALRNGIIGRAMGFDVLMSNVTPNPAGDDNIVQAGYPGALSYAEQITSVEAFRPEDRFEDAVKGLHVYGAKLVRATGIATLLASQT